MSFFPLFFDICPKLILYCEASRKRWGLEVTGVKAKAPIEKKFYQQLAHEERGQLLIFQDMHEYFIDPVHWFSEKEKLHWDGT